MKKKMVRLSKSTKQLIKINHSDLKFDQSYDGIEGVCKILNGDRIDIIDCKVLYIDKLPHAILNSNYGHLKSGTPYQLTLSSRYYHYDSRSTGLQLCCYDAQAKGTTFYAYYLVEIQLPLQEEYPIPTNFIQLPFGEICGQSAYAASICYITVEGQEQYPIQAKMQLSSGIRIIILGISDTSLQRGQEYKLYQNSSCDPEHDPKDFEYSIYDDCHQIMNIRLYVNASL